MKLSNDDIAEIALKYKPPTTVSEDEKKCIISLIRLWETLYDHRHCSQPCDCAICVAMEEAGAHETDTFTSLVVKCQGTAHIVSAS